MAKSCTREAGCNEVSETDQDSMTMPSDSSDIVESSTIESYLRELAVSRDLPDLAIRMCLSRYDESRPALKAVLDRAGGEKLTDEDANLLFRGLYILAAKREHSAFQPLLRVLQLEEEELNRILDDVVTVDLPRIVVSVFDGDSDALFEAIADRRRDEFVRHSLFKAAMFLAFEKRIERERMIRFIERFWEERLAEDEAFVWIAWIDAISTLGLRSLSPLVEKAWRSERIPKYVMEPKHFREDLAKAEKAPDSLKRFEDLELGYIDDPVAALEWTRPEPEPEREAEEPEPKIEREAEERWAGKPISSQFETYHNPLRHVGRNDPCPCGSGKKAKRCCLVAG
jgi:hypothetical protein